MFCISCGFSVIWDNKDCIPGDVKSPLPVLGVALFAVVVDAEGAEPGEKKYKFEWFEYIT